MSEQTTEHPSERTTGQSAEQTTAAAWPDAVIGVDAGGRIVTLDAGAETLFGYGGVELRAQPVTLLLPGVPLGGAVPETVELEGRRRDGTALPARVRVTPVPAGEPVAALVTVWAGPDPLRRISHDLRNALGVVLNYATFLQEDLERLPESETTMMYLEQIQRGVDRALGVAAQLVQRR